jgi:group I intron endonuclease
MVARYVPKLCFEIYCAYNTVTKKCYVGLTSQGVGVRINQHAKPSNQKQLFQRSIAKHKLAVFKIGVIDFSYSREVACERERFWIATLDCLAPGGYNLTSGGDGAFELAGITRQRLSKSTKERLASPEGAARHSVGQVRRYADYKAREELIKQGYTGLWQTDREYMLSMTKAALVVAQERRWATADQREKMSLNATVRQSDPALRKHMSLTAIARLKDPKERKKISIGLRAYLATEKGFQARSISMKKAWETRRKNNLCALENLMRRETTVSDKA